MQIALVVAVLAVAAVAGVAAYRAATKNPNEGIQSFTLARGRLTIDVTLSGAIQNRDQVVIKNEVEGKTTIISIISEGNYVQKGDLLVKLDSSAMEEQMKQQEITVINADAAFVAARENLAITDNQGKSDVKKAELDLQFAKMDLEKYQQGDYRQMLQQAQSDKTLADQTLQKSDDQVTWSRRLKEEGYITATELQSDELTAKKAQLDSNLAQVKLWLLEAYTNDRNLKQYQSNVEQAEMALDRVRRKASADLVQAEASLKAKESEFARQKERLEKVKDQIAKCTILAPALPGPAMVVYSTTGKMRWGAQDTPLQEGTQVIERQELIYLPTTASMMAEVKIPESSLRKIKKDLPARITVDAVPGKTYWGRVGKIGLLPDAQDRWMNPDLKVYNTQVLLEGEGVDLHAGMGCRVEIIVEEYDQELFVPVQSVVRVGERYMAYVLTPRGPEQREVEVGLDNNRMVHILSGLKEGEKVMQTPPLSGTAKPGEDIGGLSTSRPASLTQPSTQNGAASQPAIDPREFRKLSPEEQKKVLDTLTPEQRQELMKVRGPRDPNSRRPREGRAGGSPQGEAPGPP